MSRAGTATRVRGVLGWLACLLACQPAPPLPLAEPPPPGAFTLVVMPDTQGYFVDYKWDDALTAQTRWIAENAEAHNIAYVIHLGDIVNNNRTTQWQLARGLFNKLHDGDAVKVPYALVAGNHDLGPNGLTENRWTLMTRDEYFGVNSPYGRQPGLGGLYEPDSTNNVWHEFTALDKKWMILALEFGPRDDVVRWAGEVLDAHPEHNAIVVTHAYLYSSNGRFRYLPFGGAQPSNPHNYPIDRTGETVNDGEELWDKLISKHANVRMVLSGHVLEDGEGRITSVGDHGQVVHQLVQNFQPGVKDSEFGGNGFMRLMEFWPDGETVRVRTFSPFVGEYNPSPGHEFFLTLHDQKVGIDHAAAIVGDAPLLYYRLQHGPSGGVRNWVNAHPELDGAREGEAPGPAEFDGDDSIRTNAALPRLTSWTLEAWVRPALRGSRQVIFTNDRPPTPTEVETGSDSDGGSSAGDAAEEEETGPAFTYHDDVLFGITPEGSRFGEYVSWAVSHRDDTGARTLAESSLRVLADRWSHVVATGDGEKLRLYVNGELASEVAAVGEDLDLAGVPALFGRSENIAGAAFHGTIGEVAVYDRALGPADVSRHRMAAFSRVTAARVDLRGTADPDGEEYEGATLLGQGMPGLSVTLANRGDIQVFEGSAEARNPSSAYTGGNPLPMGAGVLLASVAENGRAGVVASAAISWNSWGQGILGVSTTQVGAREEEVVVDEEKDAEETPSIQDLYDVELSVLNEVNADVALAWFPFRGGWRGGHIRADGLLLRGNGLTQADVTEYPDSVPEAAHLQIDLEEAREGMLFALAADGRNRVVVAGPRSVGLGWEVRVQPNSVAREDVVQPKLEDVLEELKVPPEERKDLQEEKLRRIDSIAVLYLPLDTVGLIGGTYDGIVDASQLSVGEFTMTKLDEPGAYQLEIASESPETGVLVLTGADLLDPNNVALTYEGDEFGAFQIRAWEVMTAAPRDTVFMWAFIRFAAPPELPR
jgi:hypothetical protein